MRHLRSLLVLLVVLGCAQSAAAARERAHADIIIRNGTVVDGTGSVGRRRDVAIRDGRIWRVALRLDVDAPIRIDARGMIVAPGFIDIHNHSYTALASEDGHLNESFVQQGVTTIVGGPDGDLTPAAIRDLIAAYQLKGIGTNVAFYVGHNGVRREVMGANQDRAPSHDEVGRMRALVREGMELGAVGLSTGLMYSPGLFSETDEVLALAQEVAPYQGLYESHVRDPHRALLQSNWEAIEIGRAAGVSVDLTHLTTPGRNHRGLMRAVLAQIEDARQSGVTVVADQYPYTGVATLSLWGVLNYPPNLNLRTQEERRSALLDPARLALIREETLSGGATGFSQYRASGPSSLQILSCPSCSQYESRFISEIAAEKQMNGFDAVVDLLVHAEEDIIVTLGGFYEEDMRLLMRQPWTIIASDGGVHSDQNENQFARTHPRFTGTFPRVLGRYVRDERVLTLEDAVRKMTSAPADLLGLQDRGRLRSDAAADIVVFDPRSIADRSTWRQPLAPPVGVLHVIVNGELVLRDGELTGAAPGAFLKRDGDSEALGRRQHVQ